MHYRKWTAALLILMVIAVPAILLGDWGAEAARRAVGRVAREAIEDALQDAAVAAVLDNAIPNAVGSVAAQGIETAIRAAEVADTLDDVMDAAEAVKTIRKIGKIVR
jgi:uncharacterized membrane protein